MFVQCSEFFRRGEFYDYQRDYGFIVFSILFISLSFVGLFIVNKEPDQMT